ncbi:MAG TPA: PDZ domain-containing protein [Candidatus Limnocylindrales bacterium]|nr:PDZ domain-containing protein [Candidatus Limnocylindrales bacterium]
MKRVGWALAACALAAVASPAQGSAAVQQQDQAECRCVDADGDPIENCTCFRMPRVEMALAPFAARPRLGISVDSDQLNSMDAQGAEVTSVLEEGPAAEAGLRDGDIITRIDGQSLLSPLAADVEEDFDEDKSLPVQRLLSIARGLETGDRVEIEYLRDGERLTATVEAQELSGRNFAYAFGFDPERIRVDSERMREQAERIREQARDLQFEWNGQPLVVGAAPWIGGPLGMARHGVQLVELNEGLGSYFGASEGVLVTEVDEDSTLGLSPGDVILSVGDRAVATPDRVLRLLATYEDDEEVRFRVRRNGSEVDVMGRVEG